MERIKIVSFWAIIVIFCLNLAINTKNQMITLRAAKKENEKLEARIADLKRENSILEQKIAWSTSSAYINQQARDKLGLGGDNDYWLEMEVDVPDLYPTLNDKKTIKIWKMWFDLFDRK